MKHVDGIKILDTRSNFKILAVTYITRGSLEECVYMAILGIRSYLRIKITAKSLLMRQRMFHFNEHFI